MIAEKIINSIHFQHIPGDGNAIVFLHGWGNSIDNLRPLAMELPDFDRYLIDLPGFGESPAPISPATVPEYADAIADWCGALGTRPWIIGHSFGGKIAMDIAARRYDAIRGIIIIAGSGIITGRARMRRIILRPAVWAAHLLGIRQTKIGARLQSSDYKNTDGVMRETLTLGLRHQTLDAARAVRVPVLLVYGDRDTETPASGGRKFARAIVGSKLKILHGFGHNDILTNGRFQLSSLIKRFLK